MENLSELQNRISAFFYSPPGPSGPKPSLQLIEAASENSNESISFLLFCFFRRETACSGSRRVCLYFLHFLFRRLFPLILMWPSFRTVATITEAKGEKGGEETKKSKHWKFSICGNGLLACSVVYSITWFSKGEGGGGFASSEQCTYTMYLQCCALTKIERAPNSSFLGGIPLLPPAAWTWRHMTKKNIN